jgi:tetratricopeptide (TPR) repeat protein
VDLSDSVSMGERLLILGADAGASKDSDVQLDHLRQAVQLYPDDERLHVRLGDFYLERNNYADAVRSYLDALDAAPEFSVPHQRMGLAYMRIGRLDHAEKEIRQYVESNASDPGPNELLARLLLKAGRFDEAQAAYEKVLALDPGADTARIGLGNILLFQDRFEEALALFRKMYDDAQTDEQRWTALEWVAATHVHAGDDDEALEELGRALEVAERADDVEARAALLARMGQVLLEGGDPEGAMERFRQAKAVVDEADVSDLRKERARRDFLYHDGRVAIAAGSHPNPWEKVAELRSMARFGWVPGVAQRVNELGGRISLKHDNFEMAARKLQMADQTDPRVLYLLALAYRGEGKSGHARRICAQAANFNEARFEAAFVRDEARKLLAEL